ncbi:AraC family transcriptional regulator [Bosea sp. TWI1241]|uniref:helix-turn-helix domain-containing protein n=1 Tax=Bosea sp. TWI1241 TaxID=3148904 RepID=UPI003208A660
MDGTLPAARPLAIANLEEAAERLRARIAITGPFTQRMNTPAALGKVLTREVQPGLFAGGYDVEYLVDMRLEEVIEPSLSCSLALTGAPLSMECDGHGTILYEAGCPVLIALDAPGRFVGHCQRGRHCAAAGLVIKSEFFERFRDREGGHGLAPLQDMLANGGGVRRLPPSRRLAELAHQSLSDIYSGSLGELFLEGCTLSFAAELCRIVSEDDAQAGRSGLGPRERERAFHLRATLDEHIVETPSLDALAAMFAVNATTLGRQFRQAFGSTIFGYVRSRRLDLAQLLLRSQDLPVSAVGYRVGFASPAAFAAAYRRRFGYAPSLEAGRSRGETIAR